MEEQPYVVVRAERAGAWAGFLESQDGNTVVLRDGRRLWYWDGAASLSELAVSGTRRPVNCKFPEPIGKVQILGVIEVMYATDKARESIQGVPVWHA